MEEYYRKFINDVSLKSTIYYIVNVVSSKTTYSYYTLDLNPRTLYLKLIVGGDAIHIWIPLATAEYKVHKINPQLTIRREINSYAYWCNADTLDTEELIRLDKGILRLISIVSPLVNKLSSSYLYGSKVYSGNLSNLTAQEELELINQWVD